MKTLVIVPAYNEAKNIGKVIGEIKQEEPNFDILVIDDGSTDNTTFAAQNSQKATVITLPHNLGIGGAVQSGFKYAERNNYEIIIRVDGDGQHRADEIKRIVGPVLSKEADLVIGSRFLKKDRSYPSLVRRIGQTIISFLISIIIREKISDSTSGFRCYSRNLITLFNKYYPSDYPEPEEIIFLKKNKFKIKEVAVSVKNRVEGNSSLTAIKSIYYMIKVILAIFISVLRTPVIKEDIQ